ncbi:hypothetical protein GN557_004611 [Salmonella enterica]|nr:hypothetical protein [Salmonella enterica]
MILGFRGAALNQSRSASGVYTGLVMFWHRRSHSFAETTKCAFRIFEVGFDAREGQLQGRLNRWLASLRETNHLRQVWGSLQAVKSRYASALDCFPLIKHRPKAYSGSDAPKHACSRRFITPSLFTSVFVRKAA